LCERPLFFADVEFGRKENTGWEIMIRCREMPIICVDAFTVEIKDDKIIVSYYMEAVDEIYDYGRRPPQPLVPGADGRMFRG
jgi:hypothetical protein